MEDLVPNFSFPFRIYLMLCPPPQKKGQKEFFTNELDLAPNGQFTLSNSLIEITFCTKFFLGERTEKFTKYISKVKQQYLCFREIT